MRTTDYYCEDSDSFLVVFKKTRKKLHSYIAKHIKEYELTANQIDVLIFLLRNKNYNTAKDIVEYIGVSKGLVSRSVDGLIKRNFLYVHEDEKDRRKLRLFLTEKGSIIVETIEKHEKEFISKLVENISKEEFDAQIAFSKKILSNLQNIE